MKKKIYEKPSMTVVLLQHKTHLLTTSDPTPPAGVPWWDGEGD